MYICHACHGRDIDCNDNFRATLFETYVANEQDVKAILQERKRLTAESNTSRSLETRSAKRRRGAEKTPA
eukprot:968940-Rhodomonas_salina.1